MKGLVPQDDLSGSHVKQKTVLNVFRVLGPLYATYAIFLVSVFFLFIPGQEAQLMDQKKGAIVQLTDSVISLLAGYETRVISGDMSPEKARSDAKEQIRNLRYGDEGKDYFWINDYHPFMVMHPYRPDLEGRDLTLFKDPVGNHPFVSMVKRVMDQGAGFVNYYWQWKDTPEKVVPKISYVKGFPSWGWIIGTGIYEEDIHQEISRITRTFVHIFSGILAFIVLLSLYIARQVFRIEQHRSTMEKERNLETLRLTQLLALSQLTGQSRKAITRFALKEAVLLTGSQAGYLAFMSEDQRRITLNTICEKNETTDISMTHDLSDAGAWAEAARTGSPFVINSADDLPDKAAEIFPLDQFPVTRMLCVPVYEEKSIIALAGVANKAESYDASDVRQLQLMMSGMWKILEKSRSEARIRESEAKYRILADNATDAIWILDLKTLKFSYVSPAMEHLTGYTPKECVGMEMGAYMTEESLDKVLDLIAQGLEMDGKSGVNPDRSQVAELNMVKKDGERIWAEVTARFLRDHTGKPDRILGISRNVTRRKNLEKQLKEINADLSLAQKIAGIGNWSLDAGTGERIWSEEVYRIYERDPEKGPCSFEELEKRYAGGWWGRIHSALERAMSDGSPFDMELKLSLPSGQERWVHVICDTEAKNGSFLLRGTIQDITERRRMEQRIQQTQKMEALGTLAGGISHDFNNILSSMMGFADLARMKLKENPEIQKLLDHVVSGGLRARDLVNHILIFSRKADVQRTSIRIAPLVKECLKFLRASLPPKIDIHQHILSEDLSVMADPTQIHQVLMNLFTNSVYAMKESGGTLEVRLESVDIMSEDDCRNGALVPGPYVRLVVSDTGCGIPKDVADKIFEPFFTTKARGEGTGMGLSMTYGIITEMGGTIAVYSEPGMGATFQILIPEETAPAKEGTLAAAREMDSGEGRILLVDDEPGILSWSSQVLGRLGYEVVIAENGEDGLAKASEEAVDLVITDLAMPGMTGLELAREIRAVRPDLPVVLCTGFSEGLTREGIQSYGVDEMVMKPMIASELARVVSRALASGKREAP